jgi:hypothetical protein
LFFSSLTTGFTWTPLRGAGLFAFEERCWSVAQNRWLFWVSIADLPIIEILSSCKSWFWRFWKNGYLLGYHYDSFDGDNGLTAYISYILFKDNIICTEEKECIYHCVYNGVYNSIRKLTDLDDLPSSFDKKEWQEIFESIFILYTIK